MFSQNLDQDDLKKLEILQTIQDAGGFWRLRVEETESHRKYWEWRDDHWEYLKDVYGRPRPETYPELIDKQAVTVLERRINYSGKININIQDDEKYLRESVESGLFDVYKPTIALQDVVEKAERLEVDLILHLKESHDDLIKVPPKVFEHLVAEFFAFQGFRDVRLVGSISDTSADIFAAQTLDPLGIPIRFFVEIKRWRKRIGIEVVNQVLGAMLRERPAYGWHAAIVVALGGVKKFKQESPVSLSLKGVELKERDDLLQWLDDYKPNDNGLWLPNPKTTMD